LRGKAAMKGSMRRGRGLLRAEKGGSLDGGSGKGEGRREDEEIARHCQVLPTFSSSFGHFAICHYHGCSSSCQITLFTCPLGLCTRGLGFPSSRVSNTFVPTVHMADERLDTRKEGAT